MQVSAAANAFLPCQTPQSPASWGWNAVTALRARKARGLEVALTTSAPEPVAVLFPRLSPHLAYDCSALALQSLKSQQIIYKRAEANDFSNTRKIARFIFWLRIMT